ncbi:MAG: DNA methyltransferase [Nitrososphaerota archaeon]
MTINMTDLRKKLYEQIIKIDSAEDVFDLFKILNYPDKVMLDTSSKRRKSNFEFRKEDEDKIKEIYSILTFEEKLPLFLVETTSLAPSFLRSITNTFDKQYLQFLLIVTIDYSEMIFIFPDKEKIDVGKHKLRLVKLVINKEDIVDKKEYYSVIETLANIYYENEVNWRDIWKKWKNAFSVERVTKEFFERYKEVFFKLRDELHKQRIPDKESHEFTLQFLNRIMFIYFVSKKNWLERPKFIDWLWSYYKGLGKFNSNEFYEKWLKQVFLKAFNNRANEIKGLPDEVVNVISNAPYLNGGLFRENDLDNLKVQISDRMLQKIFEFFESYNFTIKEDMPLESEVAVDPQMIGYVYESLANVAEDVYKPDEDLRKKWGIFYTPKVEVDFMCRRSLVEYLSKNLSEIPKEKFYHLVFDMFEEKDKTENWFTKENLWRRLEDTLNNLSVVDPACGSGAFLVGMLNVVSDIYKTVYKHVGGSLTDFALKNRVIQYSLYGVDVMPWAIHTAELRLWLQLIVETDFKKEELRQHPLLPNLNLNLRVGDSLVQEIGGISFNLRTNNLKPHLMRKLEELKQEKRKYFENSSTAKFKTPEEVREEEIRLFEEIIDERVESLSIDIQTLEHNIKMAKSQVTLAGEQVIDEKKVKESEQKIESNNKEIEKLKSVKQHLNDPEKKPFIWDIDFAEIFGDKGGFDIVIGNPPYVAYKEISPPNILKRNVTSELKKDYKDKLIESVKIKFAVIKELNGMSDYYVYFYFNGLSLLNHQGTLCFITSNFWLDVDYGKELKEFLTKYVPIIAIYDSPKRSFSRALINTVITVFGAPEIKQINLSDWTTGLAGGNGKIWSPIKNTAKFVMFKRPFEEALSTKNLLEIENVNCKVKSRGFGDLVKNITITNDYRIFPILQEDLLEDGWEYPDDYDAKKGRFRGGKYVGNKWGGKYLRAPDIFFKVLESNRMIRLGSICEVKTGLKESGYSSYIKPKESIKSENFIPIVKNVRKFKTPYISQNDSLIIKNIKHYEEATSEKHSIILWPAMRGEKHFCLLNPHKFAFTGNFFGIEPYNNDVENRLFLILNSTLTFLLFEILSRQGFGGGSAIMVKSDLSNHMSIYDPSSFDKNTSDEIFKTFIRREIKTIFEECGIDPNKEIRRQEPNPLPDRVEIDNVIFDGLGLAQEERKEVYWSVCEMVKQRIDKAKSLRD